MTDRGSPTSVKLADLAILSQDPLAMAVEQLTDLIVDQAWVGGHLMYER
jgi:predicted amidohydrolase YtcJ